MNDREVGFFIGPDFPARKVLDEEVFAGNVWVGLNLRERRDRFQDDKISKVEGAIVNDMSGSEKVSVRGDGRRSTGGAGFAFDEGDFAGEEILDGLACDGTWWDVDEGFGLETAHFRIVEGAFDGKRGTGGGKGEGKEREKVMESGDGDHLTVERCLKEDDSGGGGKCRV